ncbi:MAG: hypothetical protein GY869_19035, partial [Planctomycetes bacterium]|nr:hypothetical protein [Planctomycetota bacterium]
MSALREKGTLIHSYLEDGYGAHFHDCATIAGWAYLERYIIEELLDGKLAHCIGGLTSDPIKRVGWVFALDEIHQHDSVGSMIYGDTISFTHNFAENQGVIAEYLLWDIMAQMQCPTGHAVLSLTVTEAVRTASVEEIVEAQIFGRRIEQTAKRLYPYVDFSQSQRFSDQVASRGKEVFTRAMEGLADAGVDIKNPHHLLYILKQLGPATFEEEFGIGEIDQTVSHGRKPSLPTE